MKEVLKCLMDIAERMEQDLASLKGQITRLLNDQQPPLPKRQKVRKSVQSSQRPEDEMKELWKQLESEYLQRGHSAAFEFVKKHTKPFLRAFVKANNLPVDRKGSKDKVAEQLIQLLAVGKAISRPTFTRPPRISVASEQSASDEGRIENPQT